MTGTEASEGGGDRRGGERGGDVRFLFLFLFFWEQHLLLKLRAHLSASAGSPAANGIRRGGKKSPQAESSRTSCLRKTRCSSRNMEEGRRDAASDFHSGLIPPPSLLLYICVCVYARMHARTHATMADSQPSCESSLDGDVSTCWRVKAKEEIYKKDKMNSEFWKLLVIV